MEIEAAIRATEVLLAFVILQQSVEHLFLIARAAPADEPADGAGMRALFAARAALAALLLAGVGGAWASLALLASTAVYLHRYDGAYNGGADRMGVLILICLTLAQIAPSDRLRELAFGYLAAQLILSYFISGWVKIAKPAWRSGEALRDVFLFSAYPVSEGLRAWSDRREALLLAAWAVMLLEVLFPFALLSQTALIAALILAAGFHLSNALFFGLNRFFWTWLTAYPSLLWLQARLTGGELIL